MVSQIAVPDSYRTAAFGALTANYTAVGTPFLHSLRMFRIVNTTNTSAAFSVDGVNNHFILPAGTFVLYDVSANNEPNSPFYLPYGTQFYVKYLSAPASGDVYVEGIYGRGE